MSQRRRIRVALDWNFTDPARLDSGLPVRGMPESYNLLKEQVEFCARFASRQIVRVAPLRKSFDIAAGEMIRIGISRNYHLEACIPHLEEFRFGTEEVFTDDRNWFALILLRRTDSVCESSEWRI